MIKPITFEDIFNKRDNSRKSTSMLSENQSLVANINHATVNGDAFQKLGGAIVADFKNKPTEEHINEHIAAFSNLMKTTNSPL